MQMQWQRLTGTQVGGLLSLAILFVVMMSAPMAWSQLAYELDVSGHTPVQTKGVDQSRGSHEWVVYTPNYGFSTRTNEHGVDIPVLKTSNPNEYQVSRTSHHMACFQRATSHCGDTVIPQDGLVLSAHGIAMATLKGLTPGKTFRLTPQWFQTSSRHVDVVDPTVDNNARFCGFPGCRGSGQLIVYTPQYAGNRTGTNEFGFEVTVLNGMVVAQEGSDSYIPEGGVVLSGHGSSRNWLIEHAPLGARIDYDPVTQKITSRVDVWTYRYQLAQRYDQAVQTGQCQDGMGQVLSACQKVQRVLDELAKDLDINANGESSLHYDLQSTQAQLAAQTLQWFQEQLWQRYPRFQAQNNGRAPIQGVWHRPVETRREDVVKTLAYFRASGVNTVFLETYYHGYTLFPSNTMVQYGLPKQNPAFVALGDPLKVWVEEAHKVGIQVQPWIETFYAGNKVAPPTSDSVMGPIVSKYPDWANVTFGYRYSGHIVSSPFETGAYFLDPVQPEVQEFLLSVLTEMVERYDIDGLQLDYIRYPSAIAEDKPGHLGSSWGYTAYARRVFYQKTGVDPADFTDAGIKGPQKHAWEQWKRFKNDAVSRFVNAVSVMTHGYNAHHPKTPVLLSAAVFPRPAESIGRKHQDWPVWVQNQWLDAVVPMTLTSAVKVVDADIQLVRSITPGNIQVISGVFGAFNQNTPDHLLAQIESARYRGANGFSVFDSAHLTGAMSKAMGLAYRE